MHYNFVSRFTAVLSVDRMTPVNMIIEKQHIIFLTANKALKKFLYKKLIKACAYIFNCTSSVEQVISFQLYLIF